jgi:hypothetical protein
MVIVLRKATRNLSHNNKCPGQDKNPVPPSKTTRITARAIYPIRGCGYRFLVSHFCDSSLTLSHCRHDVKLTSKCFIHLCVYIKVYIHTIYIMFMQICTCLHGYFCQPGIMFRFVMVF